MSCQRVQIILLCEDQQHENFARRFLGEHGWRQRQIRTVISPRGQGAAVGWVEKCYPLEVAKLRSAPHVSRSLVVILDADRLSVAQRMNKLAAELKRAGQQPRGASENIALIIPKRNIETWITFLGGRVVDEDRNYKVISVCTLSCREEAKSLVAHCHTEKFPASAPDSLQIARTEFIQRIPR